MAISAVYFRFTWHMRNGSEFPMLEAAACLLLTFGGVVRFTLLTMLPVLGATVHVNSCALLKKP